MRTTPCASVCAARSWLTRRASAGSSALPPGQRRRCQGHPRRPQGVRRALQLIFCLLRYSLHTLYSPYDHSGGRAQHLPPLRPFFWGGEHERGVGDTAPYGIERSVPVGQRGDVGIAPAGGTNTSIHPKKQQKRDDSTGIVPLFTPYAFTCAPEYPARRIRRWRTRGTASA